MVQACCPGHTPRLSGLSKTVSLLVVNERIEGGKEGRKCFI